MDGVFDKTSQSLSGSFQRAGGFGRKNHQVDGIWGRGWWLREGGRLFNDNMGIGAAESKGANAGCPGRRGVPGNGLGQHTKGACPQIDIGIEGVKVEVGGQGFVFEGEEDFKQRGHARCGLKMTNVCFDGSQIDGAACDTQGVPGGFEGIHLDGVS
jgi:hypothetical protein